MPAKPVTSPSKLAGNIYFHALHVPKIGWLRTAYLGCIRAVRSKLKDIEPDLVHGQGTERDCAISAIFSGLPNVITIHGNMRLIAKVNHARPLTFAWCAAKLERLTIPRTGGVVCITKYTEDAVRNLARRTWVVPNAVDEAFFDVVRRPSEGKSVLCVGNISARKNQNRLIEALDSVAKSIQFQLIFLGAAPQQDEYVRKFFELLKARPWCRYDGVAGRARLREYLSSAIALVLPSLEDNCPMAVLEAAAAGVPVAAARVGGVPELITAETTGLMFDPLSAHEMANACRRLLVDSELASRLAIEGKRAAMTRFHPRQIAQQHMEIYRGVLSTVS